MGLFDFLMSMKGNTAGPSTPAASGLMDKLNYGGVPFGVRLAAAAEALRSVNNPDIQMPGTMALARYGELNAKNKKEAEELAKKKEKADRLADKLEMSNPALAEALRADPTLIDDYGKGLITDSFDANRYKRTRADQIEDRNFGADLTREGWGVQQSQQEDSQQHDIDLTNQKAKLEEEKQKAIWARDDALRAGRKAEAKLIEEGFFAQTREELPPPETVQPTPAPIPAPIPGSTTDAIIPPAPSRAVPGLTQPEAPAMPEEGDAAPAPPGEVVAWSNYFKDPGLTPTEAALLSSAFKSTLAESMQNDKEPDQNLALGAAAEVYRKILENRNQTTTAKAAADDVQIKKDQARIKDRVEKADIASKAILSSENRAQTGDDVLNAIGDIKTAMDPKNKDWLPATGAGSWLAGFVGDSPVTGNARAIYTAVKTVQANLGFDALQKMRDESPTGGALGQVAVQELEMLQAKVAALDPTDANFASNLTQIENAYAKVKQINSDYAEDIKNLRNAPTPEHKAEFDQMYGVDAHLKFTGE